MNYSLRQQPELDRLLMIAQNESSLFAYWQLSVRTKRMVELQEGIAWSLLPHTLRIYDITGLRFDGSSARQFRDIPIAGQSSCYIPVTSPGRTYAADIGYADGDGGFVALCRSPVVQMPGRMRGRTDAGSGEAQSKLIFPNEFERFCAYTVYDKQPENADAAGEGSRK